MESEGGVYVNLYFIGNCIKPYMVGALALEPVRGDILYAWAGVVSTNTDGLLVPASWVKC